MPDASMVKTAPQGEKGSPTGIPLMGLASWAALGAQVGNDLEYVPDLQWPNSVMTYAKMRNDSQCDGLLNGTMLPITRWTWALDPNSAPEAAVRELSRDLGLPIAERNGATWRVIEQPIPRSAGRFDFGEHLREALLAVMYGHNFFEASADLVTPPDDWPVDTPLRARLRKASIRPPWTLTSIETEKDGGLLAIKQLSTPVYDPGISVERLVAYVWGKEGANWVGRSLFRSCYRPWLIKDRLMRVGAINIERNGAGVPIVTAPPGATKPQIEALDELARAIRGGDSSGGALPSGASLALMGVIGSQPDAKGFMQFLNEEMARSFLQMVQQLGQTETGSRALGGTFLDIMTWFLDSVADWFMTVFNRYLIEKWMTWNFGDVSDPNVDEYAPRLIYIKSGSATDGLAEAVDDGDIAVDEETRAMIEDGQTSRQRPAGGHGGRTNGAGRPQRAASGQTASPISLPTRQLRRQPYTHEVAAQTDFAAMDTAYNSAVDLLFMEVRQLTRYQVDELHDAIIEAAGDLDAIMEIDAAPQHRDVIASRLLQVGELAANEAISEAARQGVQIERPDLSDLEDSLVKRAEILDAVITRDVVDAAVREATRLTGGALDAAGVAAHVRDELQGRTWSGIRDQLGGAVQGTQNAARGQVFSRDGFEGDIYASELLDANTCSACVAKDGTHYQKMEDAEQDYPFGGYINCEGRSRCRGTLVKVYPEETPATLETPFGV